MTTINSLTRAFRGEKPVVSETPALITPETWEDPGLVTIGPKRYGFRCYPGNKAAGCSGIVRLYKDDGFSGDSYDVSFHQDLPAQCTCPDFTYRRKDERGDTCRHIRAVVALGLDKAPAQEPEESEPTEEPDWDLDEPIPYQLVALADQEQWEDAPY